jgi:hypothetical protein
MSAMFYRAAPRGATLFCWPAGKSLRRRQEDVAVFF